MAAWPWQLQPRSQCQSTRRTRFTYTRLAPEILCSEMVSAWNFVLWNEFSLKCALQWFQSEIQSEIFCSETISVWNVVPWNDFSLKCCALKWFQSEILCSEMNSDWKFVLLNELFLQFWALKFFALNWNFLSLSAIVPRPPSREGSVPLPTSLPLGAFGASFTKRHQRRLLDMPKWTPPF